MIQRILNYPGYLIRFSQDEESKRSKDHACIFFHGFPALRHVKNMDLAESVTKAKNLNSYILHYRGLGESIGKFGFHKSVVEGVEATRFILKEFGYSKLTLVGHSWGGMVAAHIAREIKDKIHQLILLSPLLRMEVGDALYGELRAVQKDIPHLFGNDDDAVIKSDFQKTLDDFMVWNKISEMPKNLKVNLIQAANDGATPAEIARSILGRSSVPIDYQELQLDHSFSEDRPLLMKTLLTAMDKAH